MLTLDDAMENFSYDAKTGVLARKTRANSNGSIDAYGYRVVKFKGRNYKAHRVCWLIYYGSWPAGVIDHINGDKQDNRIANLRDVSQADNVRNRFDLGISVDKVTSGLKAKYTVRRCGKAFRFRDLEDAVAMRKQIDKEV